MIDLEIVVYDMHDESSVLAFEEQFKFIGPLEANERLLTLLIQYAIFVRCLPSCQN